MRNKNRALLPVDDGHNHFKNVNDTYGHLVGNRALEDLAVIIKAALVRRVASLEERVCGIPAGCDYAQVRAALNASDGRLSCNFSYASRPEEARMLSPYDQRWSGGLSDDF